MKRTIGRRLVHLAVILLGVSFLTFLLMYVSPGDPAQKKLTAQGIAVLRRCWAARAGKLGGWTGRFWSSTAAGWPMPCGGSGRRTGTACR